MEMSLKKAMDFVGSGNGGTILHLGCLDNRIPSAVNIDIKPFKGVDKVADLNKGIPFNSNTVDGIIGIHLIEHLEYMPFMQEIQRVLKPGGRAYFVVPYFTNHRAHIGEHITPGFSHSAFKNFEDPNHPFYSLNPIYVKILMGKTLGFLNGLINCWPRFYDRFFCHLLPAMELEIVLEKREE